MNTRVLFLTCCIIATLGLTASAIFVRPEIEDVPSDRIIANLEKQLAERPTDPALHARLARFHAMAYAQRIEQYPVDRRTGEPWFPPGTATPPPLAPQAPAGPRIASAREHLTQALAHYRQALQLAPDDLVVRLGYAWALDRSGNRTAAIQEYRTVIDRAWATERDKKAFMPGEKSLAVEAGGYLEKLLDPVKDKAELDAIASRRVQIAQRPRAITPIAVPLRDHLDLDALLDRTAQVAFDADGSGLPHRWTWISHEAAWLVFDPRRTGRVTSALQLFGSVTFWAFWPHGYDALAALDDDADGDLTDAELAGVALWRDSDGDGVSDSGEVRSVASYGIVGIGVRGERVCHPDVTATATDGVRFADGTVRPTYDLIVHSWRPLTH